MPELSPFPAEQANVSPPRPTIWRLLAAAGLFAGVVMLGGWRMSVKLVDVHDPVGSHQVDRNGMGDFRDVIYFPTRAVVDGINPYDSSLEPLPDGSARYRQRYPILNLFPLYSPLVLLLFGGFAIPNFQLAACLYFIANVAMLVGFAWLLLHVTKGAASLENVLWLSSAMLMTQAGRATLLGGETSIPLALSSVAAAHWGRRHMKWGGISLAINSFKPTFGLPLGCLLLARRAWGTVWLGWGAGFLLGMAGLLIIFGRADDLSQFVPILLHNQRVLDDDPDVDPISSSTRIDTAGAIVRLTQLDHPIVTLGAFAGVLLLAAAALQQWHDDTDEEAHRLAQVMMLIATVAAIYHLVYDGLVLWGAIAWLWFGPAEVWQRTSRTLRLWIVGLLLVTQLNILPTDIFQQGVTHSGILSELFPTWLVTAGWTFVCTLNGGCLLLTLLLLARHAMHWKVSAEKSPATAIRI